MYWVVYRWKNFENRLRFDRVAALSLVSFWGTVYFYVVMSFCVILYSHHVQSGPVLPAPVFSIDPCKQPRPSTTDIADTAL